MEAFPASDDDQFEFIKAIIRNCDYYVIIIAGRYGSTASDGLSYTEKEFDFAMEEGVPILGFVTSDAASIPMGKSEKTDEGREHLSNFIAKVCTGRLVKPWASVDSLRAVVREALENAIATKPRTGWVRGDLVADVETLRDLHRVRSENEMLRRKVDEDDDFLPLPKLPSFNNEVEITITSSGYSPNDYDATIPWNDAFPVFQQGLKWRTFADPSTGQNYWDIDNEQSRDALGDLFANMSDTKMVGNFYLGDRSLQVLTDYYTEAGLISEDDGTDSPFTLKAQKLARRLRINSSSRSLKLSFVMRPKIENPNIDDEIPF